MKWETHVLLAESMLTSSRVPGSEEIISLIKCVNPTALQLSESDRERGYRLKNGLQNLLLENYGDCFQLDRHPYSRNILLIKHRTIPTIDACHTNIDSLSAKALDALAAPPPVTVRAESAKSAAKENPKKAVPGAAPKELLRLARNLLVEYEYLRAEEVLSAIRIGDERDLPALIKAMRILVEEMGAYESAAATLLSQPKQVLKDKQVRELLALAYYGRDMIPEARALLHTLHPDDLEQSALSAYADISFRDGNLSLALTLTELSEGKMGGLSSDSGLRRRIEECMQAEAEPLLRQAEAFAERSEWEQAESLTRLALAQYPHYQQARRLLARVEATKAEGECKALWARLEASTAAPQRLELLERLLELDRDNQDRIRELIAAEKAALKQSAVEDRLRELRTLAAREEWSGCFDLLLWLSRQDDPERLASAFEISPHFSVLYRNHRLLKLPHQEAKEIWLSLVMVKSQLLADRPEGCLERLEKIKSYFHCYPYFIEEYDRLLEAGQNAARAEIAELFKELLLGECSLSDARSIAARARRATAKLPAVEAAASRNFLSQVLNLYVPVNSVEDNLEDYRTALLIGNAARADSLRSVITDADQIALIDREIADYFAISVEPIAVTTSMDAPIDLASKPRCPLTLFGSSHRHALFREDEETIVVVNLENLTAGRYRSPNFKNLGYLDSLPERDHFLFANAATCNNVWRAKLSVTEAHFCAEIVINENFAYEPGACFEGMFMSCSKDNDYYAFIQEGGKVRAVKQSLDVVSNAVRCFEAKGADSRARRLSQHPDSFVLGNDCGTFVLNSNLDIPHGSSRVAHTIPMQLFSIDTENVNIYIREETVKVLNAKMRIIKQYPNSIGGALITDEGVMGLCRATETVLISCTAGKGVFYDLNTNKFSQVFQLGRLLWTETPTRWHCMDYDKDASTLTITDITDDLEMLFEWQLITSADQDVETQLAKMRQFEDPLFFNLPVKAPAHAGDAGEERGQPIDTGR